MLYTQKTLTALEFDKICLQLSQFAPTEGAKNRALSLTPTDDPEMVARRQRRTADARRLIAVKGYPPFVSDGGAEDAVARAEKGAVLSPRELLTVASVLRAARLFSDYINTDRVDSALNEYFDGLIAVRPLEDRITKVIIGEDLIADEASPLLGEIRRKIRSANNRIKDTLATYIGEARSRFLQENIVTMRNGRYVVPVKAEYRGEIKGLVHDTSSSGATVFIEPMAVVEANNELRELSSREEREIERILSELSEAAAASAGAVRTDCHYMTEIAFCYTCAAYADATDAVPPILLGEKRIEIHRGRHPLIDREKVVPIDISLGGEFDTLIITGPNTGGKTVALKTIGLFALMAQAGLQLPAAEKTAFGVFSDILVDIGDEQSIEQSLSTFSAHMVNIVNMIGEVGENSLVLFDELGAGTDPIEGAALAEAILMETRERGALSASTTHYAELKVYALETPGVQNASCEFDLETLRPTYRLVIGMPGKSNAFAISEKLGLPQKIVRRADALLSKDTKRFEEVISRLEASRVEMEKQREEAARLRREYEAFKANAEKRLKEKTASSEKEIASALTRARQLLDSARAGSEYIFQELEQLRKKRDSANLAEELNRAKAAVRERLREGNELYDKAEFREISLEEDYVLPRPLVKGDRVYLVDYRQEGIVTAPADKAGKFTVQAGILQAKVPPSGLRLLEGKEKVRVKAKTPPPPRHTAAVHADFHPEIDVRGMIGEDAWFLIDKYLDDALMAGMRSVRIIHGKGTGALRAAIQKYLKTDSRVASYRMGAFGEGDAGVTVVELK